MRNVAGAVVAALVAGAVVGALARVLMRMVNLAADTPAEFTWGGTASILVTFALAMVPGTLLAAFVRGRARWTLLVLGALFLCAPAIGIASEEVGSTSGFSTAQWVGVVAAGLGVFATIAALPILSLRLVDALTRSCRPGRTAHDTVAVLD